MELSSIFNSLILADLSVFLELALLSLSFLYITYELVWDSSSNLQVINSGPSLLSRSINSRFGNSRFAFSGIRTSPVVRGRSVSGISYRGRSLKKQVNAKKKTRVHA